MVEYARRKVPYSTHYDWISCYPEVSNDPTCDSESPYQNAQVTYSGVARTGIIFTHTQINIENFSLAHRF